VPGSADTERGEGLVRGQDPSCSVGRGWHVEHWQPIVGTGALGQLEGSRPSPGLGVEVPWDSGRPGLMEGADDLEIDDQTNPWEICGPDLPVGGAAAESGAFVQNL